MKLADFVKKNVGELPLREQVRIFSEAFRASPTAQNERRRAWENTFGCLSEETGKAMDSALWTGRRILPETSVDLDVSAK